MRALSARRGTLHTEEAPPLAIVSDPQAENQKDLGDEAHVEAGNAEALYPALDPSTKLSPPGNRDGAHSDSNAVEDGSSHGTSEVVEVSKSNQQETISDPAPLGLGSPQEEARLEGTNRLAAAGSKDSESSDSESTASSGSSSSSSSSDDDESDQEQLLVQLQQVVAIWT